MVNQPVRSHTPEVMAKEGWRGRVEWERRWIEKKRDRDEYVHLQNGATSRQVRKREETSKETLQHWLSDKRSFSSALLCSCPSLHTSLPAVLLARFDSDGTALKETWCLSPRWQVSMETSISQYVSAFPWGCGSGGVCQRVLPHSYHVCHRWCLSVYVLVMVSLRVWGAALWPS